MRDINIYDLHLLDIELFLKIAEFGSFTKAGQSLFLTQSLVSKRINSFEQILGLQLFIRSKRNVSLTPAGHILYNKLNKVNDDILSALKEAHDVQCGLKGIIRLGFLEGGNLFFMPLLEDFIKNNPQIALEINRYAFLELRNNLMTNQIDMAFTISYDTIELNPDEYETKELVQIPLVTVMNKKNRLSQKTIVTVNDLKAELLLMVNPKYSMGYSKCIEDLFATQNINPIVSQYAQSGGDHIGNLLLNKGVLIASQYFLESTWNDQLVQVPIADTCVSLVAVWKKNNINPAVGILKSQLESYIETNNNFIGDVH